MISLLKYSDRAGGKGDRVGQDHIFEIRIQPGVKFYDHGIRIVSCDREKMDIRMYTTDLYEAEAVKALKSGDRIRIAGTVYTVSELADHGEDTLEIIPEETEISTCHTPFTGNSNLHISFMICTQNIHSLIYFPTPTW